MERQIERIVLPAHPMLGRNVHHDSASRAYRVRPRLLSLLTGVRHESFLPILDQTDIGRCTGCAGTAAIYRRPFSTGKVTKPWRYTPNLDGATTLYSEATKADPFLGEFLFPPPPGSGDDTGSDGLTIAKVLKRDGIISGYLWAFTLSEALMQLHETPLITGLPWFNSMFETTGEGRAGHVVVRPDSGLAGGHEICVDELVVPAGGVPAVDVETRLAEMWVGGPNSWGTSWGDAGRWYMTVAEWSWLLEQRGDVTAFVPMSEPAPEPSEPVAADEKAAGDELWRRVHRWAEKPHLFSGAKAAAAMRKWAKATGR